MASIQFFGAVGTVTGSCYLLQNDETNLLVDYGMFMGSDEISQLNQDIPDLPINDIDGVLITHAHLDHCGRLPLLHKAGYDGPIYMTQATRELVKLSLIDSAKIQKYQGGMAIYGGKEVEAVLKLIRDVTYEESFSINNIQVKYRDAGHILGSASIGLTFPDNGGKTIVFSGDLGNSPEDIVRPTETFSSAEVVIMESTYGNRIHDHNDPAQIIQSEINQIEKSGGELLIPAFSLERTQVLLHIIDHLKMDKNIEPETAVFLDSPMAIEATKIYKQFTGLYNKHLSLHAKQDDPFDFPGLRITNKSHESRMIKEYNGPKVIIAGSGMMTGGRIVRHARDYLPRPSTHLLFVGYQGEETLGREILEGAEVVNIDGKTISVRATITELSSMSAHADQIQLIDWLKTISGVQMVVLTHGEDVSRSDLKVVIQNQLPLSTIELPQLREKVTVNL